MKNVCGCTTHVTSYAETLYELLLSRPDREMGRIQGCVAGSAVKITGYGNLPNIGDILVAPFIANNLLSIPQLTVDGFTIAIFEDTCVATKQTAKETIVLRGFRKCELYECDIQVRPDHVPNNSRVL